MQAAIENGNIEIVQLLLQRDNLDINLVSILKQIILIKFQGFVFLNVIFSFRFQFDSKLNHLNIISISRFQSCFKSFFSIQFQIQKN